MAASNNYLQRLMMRGDGARIREAINAVETASVGAITDANKTLTRTSDTVQVNNVPLTAARTVTLPTDGRLGDEFSIVRTAAATGAFNLVVGATGKNLTVGQWADVYHNGTTWIVRRAGSL